MRRVLVGRRLCAALFAAMGIACASTASGQCGVFLSGKSKVSNVQQFGLSGVRALLSQDPDGAGPLPEKLWIGGSFSYAGDQLTFGVVSWDGSNWYGCGTTRGHKVTALAIGQNGLVAVSDSAFQYPNPWGCRAAQWDGRAWQQLCATGNSQFEAVSAFQNKLYMGGPGAPLHCWDGQSFQFPAGGPSGSFKVLKVIDNELYAGGHLSLASASGTNGVYVFNGTSWRSLHSWYSPDAHVGAITKYQGDIVIGGSFGSNGPAPSSYAARWNGTSWDRLEGNITGWITALEVFQGRLYAGAGGILARWDDVNRQWETVTIPGVPDPYVQALVVFNSKLVVGGRFPGGVRLFDGVNWSNLSEGPTTGEFRAQAEFNGERYVGGRFTMSHFPGAFTFGKLQGTDVIPLGGQQLTGTITDLIVFSGSIYAGGDFVGTGSEPIRGFARWDGQQWRSVGDVWTGASGSVIVNDLRISGGRVIVAGAFPSSTMHGPNIAGFDGLNWSDLDGGSFNPITALGQFSGQLVASNSAVANRPDLGRLIAWDGAQWQPFGGVPSTIAGTVLSIEEHAGNLYVGGALTSINGVSAPNLARWDGTRWLPLPEALAGGSVNAMCSAGRDLLVVKGDGTFRWNGTSWLLLQEAYKARSLVPNTLGVSIAAAFGTPTVVQYRPCCPGDYNSSDSVDITDLTTFLNDWFAGSGLANANFDNAVNIQDVFDFINLWQVPCP